MVEHLYKTLGLQYGATLIEIKKAYRSLAKEYHPDKNKEGAEKFKEISNAYSILCDSEKLSEYKRKNPSGTSSSTSSYTGPNASGFDFPYGPGFFTHFDFGPNTQTPPPRPRHTENQTSPPPPPERPPRTYFDIRANCTLELDDIYNGTKISVEYEKEVYCSVCKKKQPSLKRFRVCERCDGSGLIKKYLDSRKAQTPIRCVFCKGHGQLKYYIDCKNCKGASIKKCSATIKIPKGIHEGQTLGVKDRGYTRSDKTKGNLRVEINVLDHPVFTREGDNLRITAKISLKEAIMGFADMKLCTHLDGRKVLVSQMCGYTIRPNSQRRLPGEGMPIYGSKSNSYGDLIITFDVEWQDTIQIPPSKAAKDAIDNMFQTDEQKKNRENVIVIDDDEDREDSPANDRQVSNDSPTTQSPSMKGNDLGEMSQKSDGLGDTSEDSDDVEKRFEDFEEARSSFFTHSDEEDMPMSDAASFLDGLF
ncbi:hypothetical protein BD408DRAFT_429757 [Parasitella parasitica]|nr:hypothetical protein BD408DRAFT_429757 [Parasitella parasitica]